MHTVGETTSSVPAFLGKLWKLVEDPSTNHLISWNSNGVSFTIRDQARFARELLPLYYKHNNMASFVRQLNMYGFHKVVSVDSGGLKLDKDEMEFAHMYFLQGQEFLLEHIKRKIPISKQEETKHTKPEVLSRILAEVRGMKGKQENVDSRLTAMKRENEALWREVASLRQKHMKQQQIVNKLIQFLISIVQPNGRGLGVKRRYPLMLGESIRSSSATNSKESVLSPDGPIIHDVTDIDETSSSELVESNEVELEATENKKETPLISEVFTSDIPEIPIEIGENGLDSPVGEDINAEQPDFNTMVELEAESAESGILERAMMASPMSPDLLMAVDPREVNSGALLSFEESRRDKNRGKSFKKQDKLEQSLDSREQLDSHLDNMQVDLDQLREVLSLQGSPLDPSTLLGVCNNIETRKSFPSDNFHLQLEQLLLPKLFNSDDSLSNSYLSMDMDFLRSPNQGVITGNEVIAYGTQFESGNDDLSQTPTLLEVDPNVDKDTVELFDFLTPATNNAPVAVSTTPAKKKKKF